MEHSHRKWQRVPVESCEQLEQIVRSFCVWIPELAYRLSSRTEADSGYGSMWITGKGEVKAFAVCLPALRSLDYGIDSAYASHTEVVRSVIEQGLRDVARSGLKTVQLHGRNTESAVPVPSGIRCTRLLGAYLRLSQSAYESVAVRPLDQTMESGDLKAARYRIRPLGADEAEAYADCHRLAFGSNAMTAAWKQRMMRSGAYDNRYDLVAEAPDGTIAGFCTGWLFPDARIAVIEPLGVHPDHRGRGLARALLNASMARLSKRGANTLHIPCYSGNTAALSLYRSLGFREMERWIQHRCQVPEWE